LIYPKKINRKKAEQKFFKIKDKNLPAVFD
jgi:hypothetical protein